MASQQLWLAQLALSWESLASRQTKGDFAHRTASRYILYLFSFLFLMCIEYLKLFWEEHKSVHKDAKKGQMPPEFKNFQFTGSLRPFQRSPRRIVPPGIMRPDYADGWFISLSLFLNLRIECITAAIRSDRRITQRASRQAD